MELLAFGWTDGGRNRFAAASGRAHVSTKVGCEPTAPNASLINLFHSQHDGHALNEQTLSKRW